MRLPPTWRSPPTAPGFPLGEGIVNAGTVNVNNFARMPICEALYQPVNGTAVSSRYNSCLFTVSLHCASRTSKFVSDGHTDEPRGHPHHRIDSVGRIGYLGPSQIEAGHIRGIDHRVPVRQVGREQRDMPGI